jgi:hypothetical protein
MRLTLTVELRDDGGVRITSPDEPGLVLSHSNAALAFSDVWPALQGIWDGQKGCAPNDAESQP